MVNIPNPNDLVKCSEYSEYSIFTWKHYCEKYNIDFLLMDENVGNYSPYPIWNKELIWKFGKGYDKIGIVDADTMVRWDAPNIFDFIEDGIYGVNDLANLDWLLSSVGDRQKFYPDTEMNLMHYLNAGVLFFTKDVLRSFKNLSMYYNVHKHEINQIKGGGREQTLLNFQLQEDNVRINLLSPSWNLFSIDKKNMFKYNWQLNCDDIPYFIKYAYVWHFTGFPIEHRVEVMRSVFESIKENYNE